MQSRQEERSFVCSYSSKHTLKFSQNVDNAKTLCRFVQELADAITQYHIKKRAPGT